MSKKRQKLSECCICREKYDDANHTPKMIKCGHTVCGLCTPLIFKVDTITCPMCKKEQKIVDPECLPTNYALRDLQQEVRKTNGRAELQPRRVIVAHKERLARLSRALESYKSGTDAFADKTDDIIRANSTMAERRIENARRRALRRVNTWFAQVKADSARAMQNSADDSRRLRSINRNIIEGIKKQGEDLIIGDADAAAQLDLTCTSLENPQYKVRVPSDLSDLREPIAPADLNKALNKLLFAGPPEFYDTLKEHDVDIVARRDLAAMLVCEPLENE
jgi:hypothetical protein